MTAKMGRPPLPTADRKTATIPPVRCSPEQRAKFALLGADWLRRAIDRAKLP